MTRNEMKSARSAPARAPLTLPGPRDLRDHRRTHTARAVAAAGRFDPDTTTRHKETP
jgi:hypothetical protein